MDSFPEKSLSESRLPVVIVGGGPVGLFLGLCLLRRGISCRILERRTAIDPHSRSIGIHPVSLDLFDRLEITEPFLSEGVQIRKGYAFTDRRRVGTFNFDSCPPPHRYVLSLPQSRTEALLESAIEKFDRNCLSRGAEVSAIRNQSDFAEADVHHRSGKQTLRCRWLVGCDGLRSRVRTGAGIGLELINYDDTYMMADFEDDSGFEEDAAIWIHKEGLVESFPMPAGQRRWVVKTDRYHESPDVELLRNIVEQRTGFDLFRSDCNLESSFGVRYQVANTFFCNRVVLAGDSAHVVSPIGGQGMNLGWINAWHLAKALEVAVQSDRTCLVKSDEKTGLTGDAGVPVIHNVLAGWSKKSRKRAARAGKRAEFNMKLGRKQHWPLIKKAAVYAIVRTPLRHIMARIFSMRWLG